MLKEAIQQKSMREISFCEFIQITNEIRDDFSDYYHMSGFLQSEQYQFHFQVDDKSRYPRWKKEDLFLSERLSIHIDSIEAIHLRVFFDYDVEMYFHMNNQTGIRLTVSADKKKIDELRNSLKKASD